MKKILLLTLMLLTLGLSGFAQSLSDYIMTTGTDATKWQTLTTTTNLISGTGDSKATAVTDIGFTFNFAGTDYTQFSVNSDGNLRFGSTVTGTGNYSTPFSASNAILNNPKINMLGCDGYITDSGHVYHQVLGTAPNRVCVIEIFTSTYSSTSRNSLLRWQVQLFETTNEIQIVYPSQMPPILPAVARQPGMCVNGSNIILIDANHNASFLNAGTSTNQIPSGNWPDVDRYYHFTIANCATPSTITASNITTSSVDITWSASASSSSYIFEYKPTDGTWNDDAITLFVSDTTQSITGLTPNTYYDVRVATDCGTEQSNYVSTTIHTECVAISVANEPYVEGFEGYASYTFPDCWTRLSGYSTSTYNYPYINNSSSTAHSGDGYCYFYTNTATPIVVALPEFVEDINTLRLDFWMKPAGTTTAYGQVEVGVMTDLTDMNTFHALKTWTAVNVGSSAWAEYTVDFDTVTPSGNSDYIVIVRRNPTGTSTNAWYFDDIKVMPIPTCDAPTDLAITGATTTSVDLTWDPGEESAFTVYYRPVGDSVYQSVSNVSLDGDNVYTLDNLTPSTTYVWYVAAMCSDGSETASNPATFATTMVPVSLPYTTDFSATSDQSWLLNNGNCANYWTMGAVNDTANALYITNDGSTPGFTVSSISVVSAAKLFTVGDDAQFQISFDVRIGGESSYDYLKMFFAPATETYPASTTAPGTTDYGYNSYSQYAFDFSDYMSQSTSSSNIAYKFNLTGGNTVHIDAIMSNPNENPDANSTAQLVFAWKNDGSGGVQPGAIISNVYVSAVSCPSPENLVISTSDAHSATLAWDENNDISAWTVEYGEHGFTLGTGTEIPVSGTPEITLSNLTAQTSYDVYVHSNCSDGSTSLNAFTTFTTSCEPYTTLPFTENFDNTTGATTTSVAVNNLPYCWSYYNHGTSTSYSGYPIVYTSATYAASGSNSLRFYTYSTSGTYDDQIAILPMFDPTTYPVNTLQLSLDVRALSTSYPFNLVVGVMSSPADKTTFIALDTITTQSTTYATYEIPFATYTGMGNYIAFMAPQPTANYNYGYVDNIVVDLIPNCPKPTHFQAASLGSNTVDLTWTENGSATAWEIEYGPAGFTQGSGTVENVTNEPPYTISGLTSNTAYDFYIRANCGSEYSAYAPVLSLTTACDAIDSLPWSDFFDTYGTGTTAYPSCWGKINTYTSGDRPYVISTNYSAPGSLYFYAGTSGTYNIAVTPPFDASIPVNTLQATFMYRATNSTDHMIVGVMTNPADANTFVPIDTIFPASSVSTWVERDVIFAPYTGNGQYIAFKCAYTSTAAYSYIDNLVIDVIPDCPKPSQLHAVSTTTSSIELGWTENGTATSWEIEYGPAGFTPGNGTVEMVSTNPYTIDNLSASTIYDFYVSSDCGGEMSEQSTVFSTSTSCGVISQLPYVNGFDAYGTGTTVYPLCWGKINTYSADRPYVNATCYAGVGSLYFYAGTSGTYNIAITPQFDASIDINTLQASFMYRATNTTDRLIVGVMSNPTDANTFVPVDTVAPATTASSWVEKEVNFSQYTGSGHYIAFKCAYTSAAAYSYIDNLMIGLIPSCPKPNQVHIVSTTSSSIELGWTENGTATSWEIEYGPTGFTPGTGDVTTAAANPFTVSNLTTATTYDFYVSAICDDGGMSDPSFTFTATTECEPYTTLPFTENFDSVPGVTTTSLAVSNLPVCWKNLNMGSSTTYSGYPIIYSSSTYSASGSNSMRFYSYTTAGTYDDQIAILPAFDPTLYPINTLQLSFDARNNGSYTFKLVVGIMSNPADKTTFEPIDTIITTSNAYATYEFPFSQYTGTGNYIAIMAPQPTSSYNSGYVDNIVVDYIPTCPRPHNLEVTNITDVTATLSWTAMGTETSWEIAYGPAGFDPEGNDANYVTAISNPFTVQNLTPATPYEFYIRALCSGTEMSQWSSQSASGTTSCSGTVDLPYSENFDSYTGSVYNDPNGIAPACWTTSSNNATYGAPHISGSGSYHYVHSGTNSMVFTCSSAGSDAYAALPTFTNALNTLTLNFWRAMESTSQGTLTVGYVTDLNDLATSFVTVATIPSVGSTSGDTISVDFTGTNIPATGNICFHWYQNSTFYSCCIDDINVTSNGSGPVITDPTVATTAASAIGQTTATLNGTITNPDNVTITAKGFEWKATAGGTYAPVTVTGNDLTYNLTGLTANTGYTYKAFITFNGTTVYGNEVTFTTLPEDTPEPCNVPTGLHTTTVENEAIAIAWDNDANVTSWNIQYRPMGGTLASATSTTNSYNITGLTGLTTYEIQVQADCGDGNVSDWCTAITAQTTNVGIESYLLNSISLYPNPANDVINVQCTMNNVQVKALEVFDVYGKLIRTVETVCTPSLQTQINVSDLASGMYFVRVTTEQGTATKSFVKK